MFNRQGTRLLSMEYQQPPLVLDVPSMDQMGSETGSVRFATPGFSRSLLTLRNKCFAGQDDELVVAPDEQDHCLHVWSLPDIQGRNQTVNQSLSILRGHKKVVACVRYDPCNDVLASAGVEKTIKLWTSNAHQ